MDAIELTSPFFEVEDIWPPYTLTEGNMMAYKYLELRGQIEIVKVHFNPQTLVTRIQYMSMEPFEEQRKQIMRQAKQDALMLDDDAWTQTKIAFGE